MICRWCLDEITIDKTMGTKDILRRWQIKDLYVSWGQNTFCYAAPATQKLDGSPLHLHSPMVPEEIIEDLFGMIKALA